MNPCPEKATSPKVAPEAPATVTVKVFGGLRDTVGGSALSVPIRPGSTVDDLLAILDRRHHELAGALRRGLSEGYLNVLVNGRNARFLTGGATRLADGDAVAFLPPIGGG
jgi:MoaD family protein